MRHMLRLLLPLVLCAVMAAPTHAAAPRAVASIRPLHFLLTAVMKGVGEPVLLISGHDDIHHLSLRPSQVKALAEADVIFIVSFGLENYLLKAIGEVASRKPVAQMAMAPGVRRLPPRRLDPPGVSGEAPSGSDWHVWPDPANAKAMARAMATVLGRMDKKNAVTYLSNAEKLIAAIDAVEKRAEKQLAPLASRPFMVVHDGGQYFESRFGLRPLAAVEPPGHARPGMARLRAVMKLAREHPGICLLSGPAKNRWADMLAREAGVRVITRDALGLTISLSPEAYPRLLENLAASYVECLKGQGG